MTSTFEMTPEEQRWLSHTFGYLPFVIIPFEGDFLVGTGWPTDRRFLRRHTPAELLTFLAGQTLASPPLRPTFSPGRAAPAVRALDDLEIDL